MGIADRYAVGATATAAVLATAISLASTTQPSNATPKQQLGALGNIGRVRPNDVTFN